jgi:hypothetical protein
MDMSQQHPTIILDADGSVVEMSPEAAAWAGVSAWQARGRTLARELAWLFGVDASRAIEAFLGGDAATERVHAVGQRRGHAIEADVVLCRDRAHGLVRLAIC